MRFLLLVALLAPVPAVAQHRFTSLLGGEGWNDPEVPVHGFLQLTYEYRGLPADALFRLTYHTETLQADYANVQLGGGVTVDARLKGELAFAGLLPDYYVDGRSIPERGFGASYVEGAVGLNAPLGHSTFMRVEVAGRRWFFAERDTADGFRLPDEAWVFSPRLSYTWWRLKGDAAWSDPHRSYARLRGVAVGITAGLDARDKSAAWGTIDGEAPGRNRPGQIIPLGTQWLRAGWQAHRLFRLQFEEHAAFGAGQDDLNRPRVGGLNPYVAPLAGAPWASYLPDAMLANMLSAHIKVVDDLEVGPLVTVVVLNDPHRTGDANAVDALVGVGWLVDWRFGDWQVDARLGWSPTVSDVAGEAAWSALLALGWGT